MTDSVVCTAKDGIQNCPYHKHVFAMYNFQAEITKGGPNVMEAIDGYYQERQIVEQMMREGWVENAMTDTVPDPYEQVEKMRSGVVTPLRRVGSRRVQTESTVAPVEAVSPKESTPTGRTQPPRAPRPQTVDAKSNPAAPENKVTVKVGQQEIAFYRARPGVLAAEPRHIRIATQYPMSDADQKLLKRHMAYAYRITVDSKKGDEHKLGALTRDSENSFVIEADMSLTNRPNLAVAVQNFQKQFSEQLVKGTGGPQGIPALQNPPHFALYYDSVTVDVPESSVG